MMGALDKDDVSLPKATVQKLISEILDEDVTFNKDSREIIIKSGIEFLMILASMSSEMAENDAKKTIAPEHVLKALEELEYGIFIPHLEKVLTEFKDIQKIREKRDSKFKNSGLSEEELLKQQEELFRKSRSKLQQGGAGCNNGNGELPKVDE